MRRKMEIKKVKFRVVGKLLKVFALASILFIVWGCAASKAIQAKRDQFSTTIPTCSESDCKQKWEAAQVWVAKNCGMKIQTISDSIIQTYNPPDNAFDSLRLAAQVIKEPLGGGRYRIVITTYCKNMWGCHPDKWDAAINFNDYLNGLR